MIRRCLLLALLIALMLPAGCAETVTQPAEPADMAFSANGSGRLAVYNGGVDRAVPQMPCMSDARHRQFDFWVGEWKIGPSALSLVRPILDGCVIEENYMPSAPPQTPGGPPGPFAVSGRSINILNPDDGYWHQTWVSIFPTGHLRMLGGLQEDVMVMGNFFAEFRWTQLHEDTVTQAFAFLGGGGATLPYTRTTGVTLAPVQFNDACALEKPDGPIHRALDFFIGTWRVRSGDGPVLGEATIAPDLNGCLIREEYATDKGFAAMSYLYFDARTRAWYRTYVDSEAERVELVGNFRGNALVLNGVPEPGPGEKQFQVRMTIAPVTPDTVLQLWETSADGLHWSTDLRLVYTRVD